LPDSISTVMLAAAQEKLESAGVLLASTFRSPDGSLRVLGRALRWVPEEAYQLRERDQLQISSDGYVAALAEAEALGAVPIWFHTHPGERASARPSEHDELVDQQLSDVFRIRSN